MAPYMPAHNKTSAYIYLQFRKQSGVFAGLIVKSPVVIIGISHTELDGSRITEGEDRAEKWRSAEWKATNDMTKGKRERAGQRSGVDFKLHGGASQQP